MASVLIAGVVRRMEKIAVLPALALVLVAGSADGHSLSPSLLMLNEGPGGIVDVTWKTPLLRLAGVDLRPVLPVTCAVTSPAELSEDSDSVTARWSVACGDAGLVDREIGVEGLAATKTDALLHVELADGRTIDTVLRASEAFFTVPAHESTFVVARRYVRLGVDHIATGYDHLLFVLGLLLLVADLRALVATVTAFTIGHSVTLTLAVLEVASVPTTLVETFIAFSIFLLAVELARPGTSRGVMRRKPWLVAGLFGLLHGLGFAATLHEAGLPAGAIPLALFCFNVGIELGQLAFVLVMSAGLAAARTVPSIGPDYARAGIVYAMGSLAVFWMIERSSPWWIAG